MHQRFTHYFQRSSVTQSNPPTLSGNAPAVTSSTSSSASNADVSVMIKNSGSEEALATVMKTLNQHISFLKNSETALETMHKFIKDVISSLTTQLERLQIQDDDGLKLATTFSKFSTDFANYCNPKGENANMTEFSKCIADISTMTRSVYATHDKTLQSGIKTLLEALCKLSKRVQDHKQERENVYAIKSRSEDLSDKFQSLQKKGKVDLMKLTEIQHERDYTTTQCLRLAEGCHSSYESLLHDFMTQYFDEYTKYATAHSRYFEGGSETLRGTLSHAPTWRSQAASLREAKRAEEEEKKISMPNKILQNLAESESSFIQRLRVLTDTVHAGLVQNAVVLNDLGRAGAERLLGVFAALGDFHGALLARLLAAQSLARTFRGDGDHVLRQLLGLYNHYLDAFLGIQDCLDTATKTSRAFARIRAALERENAVELPELMAAPMKRVHDYIFLLENAPFDPAFKEDSADLDFVLSTLKALEKDVVAVEAANAIRSSITAIAGCPHAVYATLCSAPLAAPTLPPQHEGATQGGAMTSSFLQPLPSVPDFAPRIAALREAHAQALQSQVVHKRRLISQTAVQLHANVVGSLYIFNDLVLLAKYRKQVNTYVFARAIKGLIIKSVPDDTVPGVKNIVEFTAHVAVPGSDGSGGSGSGAGGSGSGGSGGPSGAGAGGADGGSSGSGSSGGNDGVPLGPADYGVLMSSAEDVVVEFPCCAGFEDKKDKNVVQSCILRLLRDIEMNRIMGVPLETLMSVSREKGRMVPAFMQDIIGELDMHGVDAEGIFRISGALKDVEEIKAKLEDGQVVDYSQYSPHAVSGVLKLWLRSLPNPLFTFELYNDFNTVTDNRTPEEALERIAELLPKLPDVNRNCLRLLILFLNKVSSFSAENKMDAGNLSIVLSPPLLRQPKSNVAAPKVSLDYNTLVSLANTKFDTLTFMIQHAKEIFAPISFASSGITNATPANTGAAAAAAAAASSSAGTGSPAPQLVGSSGGLSQNSSGEPGSNPRRLSIPPPDGGVGSLDGADAGAAAGGADDVIIREGSLSYKRERRSRPVQKWVVLKKGVLVMASAKGAEDAEALSLAGAKVVEGGGSTAFIGASRDFSFTIKNVGNPQRDCIFVAKTADELAAWLEAARSSL